MILVRHRERLNACQQPTTGKGSYLNSDFKFVNKCAHFDYQQQRSSSADELTPHHSQYPRDRVRAQTKAHTAFGDDRWRDQAKAICILCRYLSVLDLREMLRFRAIQQPRQAFSRPMSWEMYHHVAHQASAGTLEEMLQDLSGLTVSKCEILQGPCDPH